MSTDDILENGPQLHPIDVRKSLQSPEINSSKSLESLYTTSGGSSRQSSLHMYTRRPLRQPVVIAGNNEIRQRVISARLHSMRNIQNKLNDAQQHVTELMNENRLLRTLHKRQDSALTKYEHSNAELPQLLHSHSEEVRVWQARCRNLQNQNKDLASKMKQKDSVLLQLSDQNKHLVQLSTDRNLEEREKLQERVRYLEVRILEKDDEMKVLLRRIQLDAKNYKSQLIVEQNKSKDLQQRLEKSVQENYSTSKSSLTRSTRSSFGGQKVAIKPAQAKLSKASISVVTEVPSIHSIKGKSPIKMSPSLENRPPIGSKVAEVPSIQSIHSSGTYVKTEAMPPTFSEKQLRRGNIITLQKPDVIRRQKKPILANEIRNGMGDLNQCQYSGSDLDESDRESTANSRTSSEYNELLGDGNNQGTTSDDSVDERNDKAGDIAQHGKVSDLYLDRYVNYSDEGTTTIASSTSTLMQTVETIRGTSTTKPSNIETIRNDMRKDIATHESFLDSLCEDSMHRDFLLDNGKIGNSINQSKPHSQQFSNERRAATVRSGVPVAVNRRKLIDPKAKSKLLEDLRAIDSNDERTLSEKKQEDVQHLF